MKTILKALKTVGWWILEVIACVLYGIRGAWRISRTPYRLVEKKYMFVKILTTIVKIVLVTYILIFAIGVIIAVFVAIGLVKSFFGSAEDSIRNNF